jgi:hypothetical protein
MMENRLVKRQNINSGKTNRHFLNLRRQTPQYIRLGLTIKHLYAIQGDIHGKFPIDGCFYSSIIFPGLAKGRSLRTDIFYIPLYRLLEE